MMTAILQVREQAIAAEQIVPLLRDYQLLPQLIREIIIDQAIAPFTCTLEEQESALKAFYASNQIRTKAEFQAWLTQHQMSREKLIAHLERALRIEKFKHTTLGNRLESYFLQRKTHLDQVIFSMVSTQDWNVAQELYFRLQEGEQTFAELAAQYSQGAESQTQGIVGPIA
ncbi:MAG TPA: peptidylprolyl isomerase, partial [Coleofasciculaceae cyanobacterium]